MRPAKSPAASTWETNSVFSMALELRQQLKLTQQLIMTPQLQMAIKLLQLSRLELVDAIRQELEENPVLEEMSEASAAESDGIDNKSTEKSDTVDEVKIEERMPDDVDWSNYIDEYNTPGRMNRETERRDAPSYESFIARKESLQDHLLWQLLMAAPSEEEERIGSLVIGNLNADGYLDTSVEEIAKAVPCDPQDVETLLRMMQTFDPVGICARDLKECLMIQARHLGLDNTLVTDIVKNHLNLLETRNLKALSRALKINIRDVVAAVDIIKQLEPKPGRLFNDEEAQHIIPDIYVYKLEGEFVIWLNDNGMPRLRVNAYYKRALSGSDKISEKTREYVQEKMRSATWLIRSIHQRQKTIYRVMESILKFQREFFEKGVSHLRPMVLRHVAEDIGMHESTISRVTTNKYVHCPQGIFELKFFFNSSINKVHGGSVASVSVQDKIRQIIEGEDSRKPYSDNQISEILKKYNINIARRTVAKYREMLKVLPSSKRRKY